MLCGGLLPRFTCPTRRLPHRVFCSVAADAPAETTPGEREARIAATQLRTTAALLGSLAPFVRTQRGCGANVAELAGARSFNSSSRRLYRELLFTAVRHWAWAEALLLREDNGGAAAALACARLASPTPEVARLRAALAGRGDPLNVESAAEALQPLCASRLCTAEELAAPAWLRTQQPLLPAPAVLLSRPPVYIRLNVSDADAASAAALLGRLRSELSSLGVTAASTPVPGCFSLRASDSGEADVTSLPSFAAGLFEVQDIGSQAVLRAVGLCAATSPCAWLDVCAGAGGKTLQLASLLGPAATVTASDVRASVLATLRARSSRAGLGGRVATRPPSGLAGLFDGVLVDAPCTGSGTWRRYPALRWAVGAATPAASEEAAATQLAILLRAASFVKPGGLLVYATCSMAQQENEGVRSTFASSFAGRRFDHAPLSGARALGLDDRGGWANIRHDELDGDAFFIASWRRAA